MKFLHLRILLLPLLCFNNVQSSTTAVNSAVKALKALDYRYFIAGGTCAAFSHGITTPVDVVKTKIQANPEKYNKGMIATTADILKTDGPNALLGGLGPTVVGYGIEGAMKFGIYEVMKPVFAALMSSSTNDSSGGSTAFAFLMASIVAGGIAALLLCPMESTRIRIVTDPAYSDKGLLSGLPKLIHDEGFWSTFSGLWAMLAKQIPYTLGKQVSFDVFAGILYTFFHNIQEQLKLVDGQIKWAVSVLAAFAASIIACIFSQPGDMILTETYRQPPIKIIEPIKKHWWNLINNKKRNNVVIVDNDDNDNINIEQRTFIDVVNDIYKINGISSFFTGTGARIVHVGLIITSQLVVYDIVKQLLGLPATGSH